MIEMLQSKTFIAQYLTGIWHKEKIFLAQQGDELDGPSLSYSSLFLALCLVIHS